MVKTKRRYLQFGLWHLFAMVTVAGVVVGSVVVWSRQPTDEEKERRARHRMALQGVARLLPSQHRSRRPLDDGMSARWFDRFFDALDPRRMYFVQADIDRFAHLRHELDDMAAAGNTRFAYVVLDLLRQRRGEATAWGVELLDVQHDFTLDERIELRPNAYAANAVELRDRWRKSIKYEILLDRSAGIAARDTRRKLRHRFRRIGGEAIDREDVMELYLTTLSQAYDPHSQYFAQRTLDNFSI